jgi:hypothetical protein
MFYRWGFDLAGEFPVTQRGHKYVLIAVEHSSALAALSSGRVQWLGSDTQRGIPVRIMLPVPAMRVVSTHAAAVKSALRRLGGDWHLVLYNVPTSDVVPPPTVVTAVVPPSAGNAFAPLAEHADTGLLPADVPDAVPAPIVNLTGAVVCKGDKWGVATQLTGASATHVVMYTDGGRVDMGAEEVAARMVGTWAAVPSGLKRRLQLLGGRMRQPGMEARKLTASAACADACAAATDADGVYQGAIIRKRFTAGTYFGVTTFLPAGHSDRAGDFVYRATYTDFDTETLKSTTVRRLAVKSWSRIPPPLHAVLRSLGGEVPGARTHVPGAPAPDVAPVTALSTAGNTHPHTTHQQTTGGQAPRPTIPAHQQQHRAQARRRRRRVAGQIRSAALAWCQQGVKLGCINVCGMTQLKAGELGQAVHAIGVDILGVAETWEGKCQPGHIAGYTYIGKPRQRGRGGGVGFFINTVLAPLITPHFNTAVPESIWLEVRNTRRGAQPVFIGIVYLPPSALTTADQITSTYAALQTDIQHFAGQGTTVVIGDFNSRVGRAPVAGEHIGQYGEVESDAAGMALRNTLVATTLFSLNDRTSSTQPPAQGAPAYTRIRQITTPVGITEQRAVLDYFLVPPQWVHTHTCELYVDAAWTPQGADHQFMWALLPHRAPHTTDTLQTRCRPNIHLLTKPSDMLEHHRSAYAMAVEHAFATYTETIVNLQQQVSTHQMTVAAAVQCAKHDMCLRIHTAIAHSIGYKQVRRDQSACKQPPVFTREVRQAVAVRRATETALVQARMQDADALQIALDAHQHAKRQVKVAVATARRNNTDTVVHRIVDSLHQRDSKQMWREMKHLGGAFPTGAGPKVLQNSDGILTMGNQQIADILAQQYERTTNQHIFAEGAGFDNQHKTHIEARVDEYRQSHVHGPDHLEAHIDIIEVKLQCVRLRNCKAPSPVDDINNELLKYGSKHMHTALTDLFNLQFSLEYKAQTPGVIVPLYKKDDPTLAINYRPITLGSTIDKLYCRAC